jgi:hypothetical protein
VSRFPLPPVPHLPPEASSSHVFALPPDGLRGYITVIAWKPGTQLSSYAVGWIHSVLSSARLHLNMPMLRPCNITGVSEKNAVGPGENDPLFRSVETRDLEGLPDPWPISFSEPSDLESRVMFSLKLVEITNHRYPVRFPPSFQYCGKTDHDVIGPVIDTNPPAGLEGSQIPAAGIFTQPCRLVITMFGINGLWVQRLYGLSMSILSQGRTFPYYIPLYVLHRQNRALEDLQGLQCTACIHNPWTLLRSKSVYSISLDIPNIYQDAYAASFCIGNVSIRSFTN